ncbi:MAG: GNAT family N-acetyltransferase [Actinomycetota bacterium]|nr:GNAT family N-acetyltransferase [Actinomycetota bacterium]
MQGLRYLVAYHSDGTPQAAPGYRVIATTRGRILFLDDLVTHPDARSKGIGAFLFDAVEVIGRESGATAIELDSGVTNAAAHRFYFAHRMSVTAFHFAASLTDPT